MSVSLYPDGVETTVFEVGVQVPRHTVPKPKTIVPTNREELVMLEKRSQASNGHVAVDPV